MTGKRTGIALCMHAGSGNHGCEALADSLLRQLREQGAPPPVTLVTNSRAEDQRYALGGFGSFVRLAEERHMAEHRLAHVFYYGWRALTRDRESFLRYRLSPVTGSEKPALAVSIGGDNYCYPSMVRDLELANAMLNRQGTRTMLLGCSIEPALLAGDTPESRTLIEDMHRYAMITAREGRTYEALRGAGIPESRLRRIPDPAFALPVNPRAALPEGFSMALPVWEERSEPGSPAGNRAGRAVPDGSRTGESRTAEPSAAPVLRGGTVGINLSPMAADYAENPDMALQSCAALIRHILAESDMTVALIPHVVWARSDDRIPLGRLMAMFRDTGRVVMAEDGSAGDLKGIIGKCRLFIGARTHATIAAYSSGVPTLVLGYSVKAQGIAEELFGTAEHYVLPVQKLREERQLIDAYEWLLAHESKIRAHLRDIMPGYCRRALENGRAVMELYRSMTES